MRKLRTETERDEPKQCLVFVTVGQTNASLAEFMMTERRGGMCRGIVSSVDHVAATCSRWVHLLVVRSVIKRSTSEIYELGGG